jgi:hypothetical protein
MSPGRIFRITVLLLPMLLAPAACKKSAQTQGMAGNKDGGGNGGMNGGPDGGTGNMTGIASLRIDPSDTTITVANGVPASADFVLHAIDNQGTDSVVHTGALWRTDDNGIGAFPDETAAHYVANGDRAGTTTIQAIFGGAKTTATVHVRLATTRIEGGAPPNADMLFGNNIQTNPAMSPSLAYPLDGVVIPKNLVPMVLQWDTPAGVDVFRVTITAPAASATIYSGAHDTRLGASEWLKILESTAGGTFKIQVAATAAADMQHAVFESPEIHVQVADTEMRGTIYYWAVNVGRILRIRPGAENYEDFFTPAPEAMTNSTCVGCHTLSRDGSKMAFEYYGGWKTQGVINTVAPTPPVIGPGVYAGNFAAFNPQGDKMLSVSLGVLTLRDPMSGTVLETMTTPTLVTHPAWSPDGNTIAYVQQVAGQSFGDVDFFQSDLIVIRNASGARTPPQMLVPTGGMANGYPSFSPDSKLIAYGRGPYSRSHTAFDMMHPSALSPGDIWLVPADGSAQPIQLVRSSEASAFLPAFSPFSGGGYLWLAFFSRRDYGHITRGMNTRQIWVTAIDQNAPAGADPSHVAFWLPAQDSTTQNMSAYWAPDPCHASGDVCALDDDCCSGSVCRPDASGQERCVSQANACREIGEPCADTTECCPGPMVQCTDTGMGPRCTKSQL